MVIYKAEIFFSLKQFEEAQSLNNEGLQFAKKIGNKEQLFAGKVLSAKIDFALGHQEKAVAMLSEMLAGAEEKSEIATLHYELWQFKVETEAHHQTALKLYQELYEKTPNIEYKKRIDELSTAIPPDEPEDSDLDNLDDEDYDDMMDSFM